MAPSEGKRCVSYTSERCFSNFRTRFGLRRRPTGRCIVKLANHVEENARILCVRSPEPDAARAHRHHRSRMALSLSLRGTTTARNIVRVAQHPRRVHCVLCLHV